MRIGWRIGDYSGSMELLGDGLVLVRERNGTHGTWNPDGTPQAGDLTRAPFAERVGEMVRSRFGPG